MESISAFFHQLPNLDSLIQWGGLAVLVACGPKHSSGTDTTTPRRGVVAPLGTHVPTNRGSVVAYSYDPAAARVFEEKRALHVSSSL